jgi:hypothetical protein
LPTLPSLCRAQLASFFSSLQAKQNPISFLSQLTKPLLSLAF